MKSSGDKAGTLRRQLLEELNEEEDIFVICSLRKMSLKSDKLLIVKLRLAFIRKTYTLFHTINNDYFTKHILLVKTSSHSYRISYKLQQHDRHIK